MNTIILCPYTFFTIASGYFCYFMSIDDLRSQIRHRSAQAIVRHSGSYDVRCSVRLFSHFMFFMGYIIRNDQEMLVLKRVLSVSIFYFIVVYTNLKGIQVSAQRIAYAKGGNQLFFTWPRWKWKLSECETECSVCEYHELQRGGVKKPRGNSLSQRGASKLDTCDLILPFIADFMS